MATLYLKTAGGNWSAAGTWSTTGAGGGDSSGPPTAADNCIAELLSGNVTVDVNSVCRSFDATSGTGAWTGTMTGTASVTLSIGDATAGPGSIALRFSSGMTFTRTATSFVFNFVSTSATQQSIYTEGETMGGLTFNGVAGSWIFMDGVSAPTAAITLTNGALDTNGQTISSGTFGSNNSNVRTLTLGATSWTVQQFPNAFLVGATNLTLNAGTSTINLTASGGDQKLSNTAAGSLTFYNLVISGGTGASGSKGVLGPCVFNNVTITGSAVKTDAYQFSTNVTISGTLTINGNSVTNRALVFATTAGTPITLTAAVVSITNADFKDITGAGVGSWDLSAISGGSGDCGGNSGITFTTATTRYWVGGTGSWSATSEWSTSSGGGSGASVPLPQDDAIFDANSFSAGSQTVTQDMPRAGKSINWTGATNSPTWAMSTTASIFGSLTLISGMSFSSTQGYTFEGRGSFTITLAGNSLNRAITLSAPGGTMTQLDAFSITQSFTVSAGTWTTGGFSHTAAQFVSTGTLTRTVNLGASTVTVTGSAANIVQFAATGLTLNAGTSTFVLTGTLTSNSNFAGGGMTFHNVSNQTAGSPNAVVVTGANTFKTLTVGAGRAQKFASATTNTIARLIAMGASGSVITITSSVGASAATLAQAGGVTAGDWMSIQDITFSPSANATFYAGANSTNVSGNTGILFKQLTAMNAQGP